MTTSAPCQPGLLEPLTDVPAWAAHFRTAPIPVLRETVVALEALAANEDLTDANSIGEMISGDPLMTLKVLAYSSEHRSSRVLTSAETVTSALVMMGIPPFFQAFQRQEAVEDRLGSRPEALAGLRRVLRRAHRGADFALGFAIHRTDPNAAAVHAAALLHEFAEMLLWCQAPEMALRIEQAQSDDPTMRSSAARCFVLNVDLADVQQALVAAWRLPALLSEVVDPAQVRNAGARTLALAARLARHTARGWDNAAVPDDIAEIAELLNLSPAATLDLVGTIESR